MGFQSGQTLSHYRLIEKIGQGGMGVVWRAEDTILGRLVAIKLLLANAAPDEERRRMFLKEARLASSVSDAHIVQVHELGRANDLDFIVMELVEGKPLTDRIGGRGLPVDKIVSIGEQVARALARAHQKQLVHRDIKPGNIILNADGDVKVVDFGLALLFEPTRSATDTTLSTINLAADPLPPNGDGRVAGTLPYMSPEQVRGETLDGRSDIFSLGTVLYEMTTGRRPFVAPTIAGLAAEIQRARLTPLRDLRPDVPMELDRIVQKALAPKPADRYQTMQDLAVDLKRLGRDLESGSAPSYEELQGGSARSSTGTWALATTSGRGRWALVALVVAIAVAASGWTIASRRAAAAAAAASAHTILIMPFEVRGHTEGADYVGRAFADALAVSLAESKGLTVLPVAGDKDLGAAGALDRIRAARSLGAGMLVSGALTREGKGVSAVLSLTDVEANRLVWGTRKTLAEEDLGSLATSLVQQVQGQLGVNLPKRYEWVDVPFGSTEFLGSRELAEAMGSSPEDRARDLEITKKLVEAFPREEFAYLLRFFALHWNYGATEHASPGWREYNSTISRMFELDPNSPWRDWCRAYQLDLDGKTPETLALLTGILAREDLSPALRSWFLVHRAGTQKTRGATMADLYEATRLQPVNGAPIHGIGRTLVLEGRTEEGLTYLQRALALNPRRPEQQSDVGEALERMGRLEEALPFYSKACELAIRRSNCVSYGKALARLGRIAEAKSLLSAACEEDRASCADYAIGLDLAGRTEEAHDAARKAEAPPELIGALYSLAAHHALSGDRVGASRYLRRFLEVGNADIGIATDPDLKSLHGDPEFEAIVTEIKKRIDS